jgi:hypothetical protein
MLPATLLRMLYHARFARRPAASAYVAYFYFSDTSEGRART